MSGIVVAGGGVAGATAATLLAQAGREVTLLERQGEPVHKICGEFISGEARAYLAALGLNLAALGGQPITHVRLVRGNRAITARLPFEGLSLTRRSLDEALLNHAADAGVTVRRGQAIRSIRFAPGIMLELDRAEPLRPQTLLLATGKHEVRGVARQAEPGALVGFKNYFHLAPAQRAALGGHVELVLFPGGYAGLQLVEDGTANCTLLVDQPTLARVGGRWEQLLDYLFAVSPHLAQRLGTARASLEAPLTIARVPYGFVHKPTRDDPSCMYRLGDQAAVIASFTGDGMAIALHSATLAARCVLAGEDASSYHHRLARGVAWQVRRADILLRLLSAPGLGVGVVALAGIFPAVLAVAARLTRVPEPARVLAHPS